MPKFAAKMLSVEPGSAKLALKVLKRVRADPEPLSLAKNVPMTDPSRVAVNEMDSELAQSVIKLVFMDAHAYELKFKANSKSIRIPWLKSAGTGSKAPQDDGGCVLAAMVVPPPAPVVVGPAEVEVGGRAPVVVGGTPLVVVVVVGGTADVVVVVVVGGTADVVVVVLVVVLVVLVVVVVA
jgi:hypothetical protein